MTSQSPLFQAKDGAEVSAAEMRTRTVPPLDSSNPDPRYSSGASGHW